MRWWTLGRWRQGVVAGAVVIALLDASQVILLPWRPKHVGALGGAVLYLGIAALVWRGHRAAVFAALLIPLLPLSIVAFTAAGVALPTPPDREMLAILAVQLLTAGCAAVHLAQPRERGPDRTT